MEEIEEREASMEQIWPGRTNSGSHNAGAGGDEQGAAVLEKIVRVRNNPSHRMTWKI